MEALLKAVMEDDEGQVGRLLDADPTLLQKPDKEGRMPLTAAASNGQLGMAKVLIERGVNVNATGPLGMTALYSAAYQGHTEMVSFLLSKGAQASSLCEGMTPLTSAASRGHLDVVRLLLQHMGLQALQEAGANGVTALQYAALEGHEDLVAFLLGQGVQAHSSNSIKTPVMCACAHGQVGVMRIFCEHMGVQALQATNEDGFTPLHVASANGHEKMVTFLLGQGAQANSAAMRGGTPFALAAMTGHVGVLRVLLQHIGAQVLQEGGEDACKPLYWASIAGHEEAVAFLLGQGAQANTKLLMTAAAEGKMGVARLIIQHMRAQNVLQETVGEGYTALHCAAVEGHVEIVRLLLLAGADPTITDNEGWTPREILEEEDEEEDEEQEKAVGRAECLAVFKWWEGELERGQLLHRATCLHKTDTMQRDMPTSSRVPTYLQARVAAGHVVPSVKVVSPQSERQQEAEEQEEERHAMLQYVVSALNEELVTELLEGFPI